MSQDPLPPQTSPKSRAYLIFKVAAHGTLGYALGVGLQLVLYPVMGLVMTLSQALTLGLGFAAGAVLRSDALQCLFVQRERADGRDGPERIGQTRP